MNRGIWWLQRIDEFSSSAARRKCHSGLFHFANWGFGLMEIHDNNVFMPLNDDINSILLDLSKESNAYSFFFFFS